MLTGFTTDGVLPPGDHEITLDGLEASILVLGPGDPSAYPVWDAAWRLQLVKNFRLMAGHLAHVGVTEVFVDGSFTEDKDHPNDIDGYFDCDPRRFASGQLQNELNRIDPRKCWTWDPASRRPYRGYPKLQLPMWHSYRVELYPHFRGLIAGSDKHGNPLEFPAYFRQRRTDGQSKGIIKLRL
ncbi:MAG: hypothetical protein WD060_07445 [Pirellulales bacterium]